MTEVFTVEETITLVARLTPSRLSAYIEAEAVSPMTEADRTLFRASDLARLDLLCDLAEVYNMGPEALAVMIAVVDRLHDARRDRRELIDAIRNEAPEVQERIAQALQARPPAR